MDARARNRRRFHRHDPDTGRELIFAPAASRQASRGALHPRSRIANHASPTSNSADAETSTGRSARATRVNTSDMTEIAATSASPRRPRGSRRIGRSVGVTLRHRGVRKIELGALPEYSLGPLIVNPNTGERATLPQMLQGGGVLLYIPLQSRRIRWLVIEVQDQIDRTAVRIVALCRLLLDNSYKRFLLCERKGRGISGPIGLKPSCETRV